MNEFQINLIIKRISILKKNYGRVDSLFENGSAARTSGMTIEPKVDALLMEQVFTLSDDNLADFKLFKTNSALVFLFARFLSFCCLIELEVIRLLVRMDRSSSRLLFRKTLLFFFA